MANVKQIKINDTIYDVEDSVARSALEQKAPLESPALTGIPTAPTASNGTNTTQIATTAFVQDAVQGAGGSYTLPVASSTTLGGVKPVAKTASMTQEVGVDASGALYTEPGSGGGGSTDISLGITGSAAGEFPKVSAVNENGVPTSWETVEGEEVTLGGDVPAPTDAQVSSAVDTWLTEHPEATTTVQDGAVTVEKLGYGKHIYGSKPYFCGAVGTGAQVYGSLGVVVPCKAGDTIYTTITVPTNASWNVPKILTEFPENQYGDIASITLENLAVNNDTKQYAIGADKTTAKALYIPQNFNAIPAANNGSVEDALAWINKTMGTDGRWCAQNVPFTELDAWYQTAQAELFEIDESCNKLMYASLYQAVSKLVGAKVAVLGDSLTEQSACSFITSAYNARWMEHACPDVTYSGDNGKTYKGSG